MMPARLPLASRLSKTLHHLSAAPLAIGLIVSLAVTAPPAKAEDEDAVTARIESIHGNTDGFYETFDGLRESARGHDAESIAAFAEYPLTVNANGETYDIQSAKDFVENFDTIVTQDTLNAITGADVGDLLVNGDGVAIGNGVVWLAAICENSDCSATHWAITAINN